MFRNKGAKRIISNSIKSNYSCSMVFDTPSACGGDDPNPRPAVLIVFSFLQRYQEALL